MKRLVFIALLVVISLVFWSCSQKTNIVEPDGEFIVNMDNFNQFVRPEFIDNRSEAVIEKFTKQASDEYIYRKKKPTHPGGGGGGGGETPADPNPNPLHKYAYIIGISNYEGTQNDLQYCDDDAQDWKNYLQGEGFTIQMDIDLQANANNIQSGLEWLKNSAVPGDEIAFIYSGHGSSYGQNGSCIISSDLYYLTHDFVMEYLTLANCSKKMVAIDACQIGDFHDNIEPGMIIATASDKSYSYDGESWMQNGVWTYYYIESLEGGEVFNENAMGYAKTQMKAWARQVHVRVTPLNTDSYTGWFDL